MVLDHSTQLIDLDFLGGQNSNPFALKNCNNKEVQDLVDHSVAEPILFEQVVQNLDEKA